jgi:hypothetical protein
MKKVIVGMLATGVAALFFVSATPACSSSACTYKESPCSADPKPTDEQIKAAEDKCKEDEKTAKCVSEGTALADCYRSNIVCTDNKTDLVKTGAAVATNCKDQAAAAQKCQTGT